MVPWKRRKNRSLIQEVDQVALVKRKEILPKRETHSLHQTQVLGVGFSEPMTLPTQWVSSGMEVHSIIPHGSEGNVGHDL